MTSYWVMGAMGLPCGARKLADAAMGAAPAGRTWLDVCILGQHLPQMYAADEITELHPDGCARLGLCPDCQGWGDTAPASTVLGLARGIDEVAKPCPNCGGSGRPALRVSVNRSSVSTTGEVRPLPHEYVPPLEDAESWLPEGTCLACGMLLDGKGPRGEVLHPGVAQS